MNQEQKDRFSASEGDAWFERNHAAIEQRNFNENDSVIQTIDQCLFNLANNDLKVGLSLLEVGCGEGKRFQWSQEKRSK